MVTGNTLGTIEERIRGAYADIAAQLRSAGVTQIDTRPDTGMIVRVDGAPVSIDIQARISWHGSDKGLRASVGCYGDRRSFPEGKNGLNVRKIAERLIEQAAGHRERSKILERKRAAREEAEARRDALRPAADRINARFGLSRLSSTHVEPAGDGRLYANVRVAVTEEQAERLLDLVASFQAKTE